MVYVWPSSLVTIPAHLVITFVFVVKVLFELEVVVVGEETFHAHQFLGVAMTMLIQGLLILIHLARRSSKILLLFCFSNGVNS